MDDIKLKTYSILTDTETGQSYRVIYMDEEHFVLCEMYITKLNLISCDADSIMSLIMDRRFVVEDDPEENVVFNLNDLPDKAKKYYLKYRDVMNEITEVYGPTYIAFANNKPKKDVNEILVKYNLPYSAFRQTLIKYLQSGLKDSSLVDSKVFRHEKRGSYDYKTKTGKKYDEGKIQEGVIVDDRIREIFDEALQDYKSGKFKTMKDTFEGMNNRHFREVKKEEDGTYSTRLLPPNERPTIRQMRTHFAKKLSKEDKQAIKTSKKEFDNDYRRLNSDVLNDVYGPGDMVQIDAWEADVSLVSAEDKNRAVGRPVVYFMVDVYSRVILAVSVSFDNNSIRALTNLFLNLADDKKELCERYSIGIDGGLYWPSNIIPRRLRVDRGAEFKSYKFEDICNALSEELQNVPGAMGSAKGVVEEMFEALNNETKPHLEHNGLITKRYDSNHHKESVLNIYEYTRMVIRFVASHNIRAMDKYPLTLEMKNAKVRPIPKELWDYGVKKFGPPRPIPERTQYMWALMTEMKASITRRGIECKGLVYRSEGDSEVESARIKLKGDGSVPFTVRMDPRSVGAVYYMKDNRMIEAPLTDKITGNIDYKDYTLNQWEEQRKQDGVDKQRDKLMNEELSSLDNMFYQNIVNSAQKSTYSYDKDIREAKNEEKELVAAGKKMFDNPEQKSTKAIPEKIEDNKEPEEVPKETPDESAKTDIAEPTPKAQQNRQNTGMSDKERDFYKQAFGKTKANSKKETQ